MAYTKQTWENGEIITAEKLNNLENGVAEGNLFVRISVNETGINASYNDLLEILQNGQTPIIVADQNGNHYCGYFSELSDDESRAYFLDSTDQGYTTLVTPEGNRDENMVFTG